MKARDAFDKAKRYLKREKAHLVTTTLCASGLYAFMGGSVPQRAAVAAGYFAVSASRLGERLPHRMDDGLFDHRATYGSAWDKNRIYWAEREFERLTKPHTKDPVLPPAVQREIEGVLSDAAAAARRTRITPQHPNIDALRDENPPNAFNFYRMAETHDANGKYTGLKEVLVASLPAHPDPLPQKRVFGELQDFSKATRIPLKKLLANPALF